MSNDQLPLPDNPDTPNFSFDVIAQVDNIQSRRRWPDSLAEQEQRKLSNENKRGESYRNHIHSMVVCGMWVIGIIIIAMIAIRAWHFLTPHCCHWLSDKENQDIERIIFGTVFISVLGKYFKKYKIIDDPPPG